MMSIACFSPRCLGVLLLSAALAFASAVAEQIEQEVDVCFDFDPPLYVSSETEAHLFSECFKEAFKIDHDNFIIDWVELEYEEDDGEGDTRERRNLRRRRTRRLKGRGRCRECDEEALYKETVHNGLIRSRELNLQKSFKLRGAGEKSRILEENIPFPTKSYTEYLVDDCVHFVNAVDGLLGDLVGGIQIALCVA